MPGEKITCHFAAEGQTFTQPEGFTAYGKVYMETIIVRRKWWQFWKPRYVTQTYQYAPEKRAMAALRETTPC